MAESRPVSLKLQQELTLGHVPACHGTDWLVVKGSQSLEGNVVFGRLGLHASFGAGVPVFMLTCTYMFYTNVDMVPPAEIS